MENARGVTGKVSCLNNPGVVLELSEEDIANDVIGISGTAKNIWSGGQT